jgi:hypothetical protein
LLEPSLGNDEHANLAVEHDFSSSKAIWFFIISMVCPCTFSDFQNIKKESKTLKKYEMCENV